MTFSTADRTKAEFWKHCETFLWQIVELIAVIWIRDRNPIQVLIIMKPNPIIFWPSYYDPKYPNRIKLGLFERIRTFAFPDLDLGPFFPQIYFLRTFQPGCFFLQLWFVGDFFLRQICETKFLGTTTRLSLFYLSIAAGACSKR